MTGNARRLATDLWRFGLVTLLICTSLVWVSAARAATFSVTTTQDAAKLGGSGANCQSTLGGNPCTLRAAVETVVALGGTHTINLGVAGTYTLTVLPSPLSISGVTLTIANTSGGSVTVDGNATGRVFSIGTPSAAQVSISGIAISNGLLPGGSGGAGISIHDSAVTLDQVTISGNTINVADGGGAGGAGLSADGSEVTATRTTVTGNTITIGTGGGSGGAGMSFYQSTGTLTDCTVTSNSITIAGGGGSGGAGIGVTDGTLTLTRVTVSGNSITGTGGGSLGGGLDAFDSLVAIVDSTINTNSVGVAGSGGGGIALSSSSVLAATNTTISGNMVAGAGVGGGINCFASTMGLSNVTLAANSAFAGSNIAHAGTGVIAQLGSSILAYPLGGGTNCAAAITASAGNNISSDASCAFALGSDHNSVDPLLGPLALNQPANYPPTALQTHALLTNSPAIDGVVAAPAITPEPALTSLGFTFALPAADERGVVRPQMVTAPNGDIGAFEVEGIAPAVAVPLFSTIGLLLLVFLIIFVAVFSRRLA